jgi:hypothetical protein
MLVNNPSVTHSKKRVAFHVQGIDLIGFYLCNNAPFFECCSTFKQRSVMDILFPYRILVPISLHRKCRFSLH